MYEPQRGPYEAQYPPLRVRPVERSAGHWLIIGLIVAIGAAAGAAWFWYTRSGSLVAPQVPTSAAERTEQASPGVAADGTAAQQERHALLAVPATEALGPAGIGDAIVALFGRAAALKFLETTDFPRRAVATLDALGRAHAPVSVWPVLPTPGRFLVRTSGPDEVIAAGNAARYRPFVEFVRDMDARQAVYLYRRMYPVLQEAYRQQGFGARSFNDRVLEVIALLLATPDPTAPVAVTLTDVKGPIKSVQPWTRYEFEREDHRQLTAGQQMMLRMGPENRRLLKVKLEEFRRQLLDSSTPAATP